MTKPEATITEHVEQLQKKYGSCNTCQGMYELGRHDERATKRANTCDMKLHEFTKVKEANLYVLRVPGGWLYVDNHGSCFVPLSKEFSNPVKYSKVEELTRRKHIDELDSSLIDETCEECKAIKKCYAYNDWWFCEDCLRQLDFVDCDPITHACPNCGTSYIQDKMVWETTLYNNESFWLCKTCRGAQSLTPTPSNQKTEKE